jgi:hypothetical protein
MPYPRSPFAKPERQKAEPASSSRSARDHLDDRFDPRGGMRQGTASIHSIHSFGRTGDQVASPRPPAKRRILRGFTRFLVTIFIGVGGTLAWQSYGEVAKEMLAVQAPALSGLLSVLPTRPPAVAAYAGPAQQPGVSASGLDALRRSVEQLAVRQEQMAQNVVMLQALGEDIRQKMSFTPASMPAALTQPAAPVAPPRPASRTHAAPAVPR